MGGFTWSNSEEEYIEAIFIVVSAVMGFIFGRFIFSAFIAAMTFLVIFGTIGGLIGLLYIKIKRLI